MLEGKTRLTRRWSRLAEAQFETVALALAAQRPDVGRTDLDVSVYGNHLADIPRGDDNRSRKRWSTSSSSEELAKAAGLNVKTTTAGTSRAGRSSSGTRISEVHSRASNDKCQTPVIVDLHFRRQAWVASVADEEYAYALDRALNTRSSVFPVIALFPATVDNELIPAGIRVRLFVSLTDPDWKERIAAAAENRDLDIDRPKLDPYAIAVHELPDSGFAIEVAARRHMVSVRGRGSAGREGSRSTSLGVRGCPAALSLRARSFSAATV